MSLSGICIVHCLALPILVSMLPMWTSASALHGWLHPVFAVLLIPTTIIAGLAGYRRHRSSAVVFMLTLGLVLILGTVVLLHDEWGSTREIVFTGLGSVILIAGHIMNWRARHNKV